MPVKKKAKAKKPAMRRKRYPHTFAAMLVDYAEHIAKQRAIECMDWEGSPQYGGGLGRHRSFFDYGGDSAYGPNDDDGDLDDYIEDEGTEDEEDDEEFADDVPRAVASHIWAPLPPADIADLQYNSIEEFMDVVRGNPVNPHNLPVLENWRGPKTYHPDGGASDFLLRYLGGGCRSGTDVQMLVRRGWPDGMERAQRLMDKLNPPQPIDHKRRLHREEFGDTLDIGSVYSGRHMTAWTRARRTSFAGSQKIDITADLNTSWTDHGDVLFWRGAAAVVLGELLEASGYMVRLRIGSAGHIYPYTSHLFGDDDPYSIRITMKEYGEPLSLSVATTALLPGFGRAMKFAHFAALYKKNLKVGRNYMAVGTLKAVEDEFVIQHEVRDYASAVKRMNEILAKIEGRDEQ